MDILSDVKITGSLTASNNIKVGYLTFKNNSIDSGNCSLAVHTGGVLEIYGDGDNNLSVSIRNEQIDFCKQVWLYGGAFEELKPGESPSTYVYYARKINKTIQVPLTCSKFLIEENIPPHDGKPQSFPVVQAVGTYSKRSVSMDYEFCGNSSVYGIISTGGCRETEFAFQILVS